MLTSDADSSEDRDLRRYLRDLAALSALPAIWSGESRQRIAEGVAEVLVTVLHLSSAHVRLKGSTSEDAVEVTRRDEPPSEEEPPCDRHDHCRRHPQSASQLLMAPFTQI